MQQLATGTHSNNYPDYFTKRIRLPEGVDVTIRPISPADARIERDFVNSLSEQSRYQRFLAPINELTPEMLAHFTQVDYDRDMALIAVIDTPEGEREIGVARYCMLPDRKTCEFAIVVGEAWRGTGLARALMSLLIDSAREHGFEAIQGVTFADNGRMQDFARSLGFRLLPDPDDASLVLMQLALD
jgi:acetyltransferase